jgi:hypothetical protein
MCDADRVHCGIRAIVGWDSLLFHRESVWTGIAS